MPSGNPSDGQPFDSTLNPEEILCRQGEETAGGRPSGEKAWPFPAWERYHFRAFLGQGAMGTVFRVYDPALKREVALKVLNTWIRLPAETFLGEARAQARVEHAHVAKVHEVGEVEGQPYLAMQLLHGQPLPILRESLTLREQVLVLRQVCDGLQAAHRQGLLHRDLKPGNIMVERAADGGLHAYVMDFGLACEALPLARSEAGPTADEGEQRTQLSQEITGTPAFMSPEQAAGDSLDCRSDVFSLGSTLYATLAGHPPFKGASLQLLLKNVMNGSPAAVPGLPKDLAAILMRAMEKDPAKRYPSAKALGLDLQRWLEGEAVEAFSHRPLYGFSRRIRKQPFLAAMITLLTAILLFATCWNVRARMRAKQGAALHQFFAQEAERIESALILAEALPLHDTLPERQMVEQEIKHWEQMIREKGPLAEAPGLYAIGRARMALQQWEGARQSLERAWDLGFNGPEAAFSLGKCLSYVYSSQLNGLQGQLRKKRQGELNQSLKPHILTCLAQAHQGIHGEMQAFSEALLELRSGNYREAHSKIDRVIQKQPWNVQAVLLKAEIFWEQVYEKPQERAWLAQAKVLVQQAINMARSCPAAYERDALVCYQELFNAIYDKKAFPPYLEQALAAVQRARQANSLSADSYSIEAQAWFLTREFANQWYWALTRKNDELPKVLGHVIACAEKARSLDPSNVKTIRVLGSAWWSLGQREMEQGRDPRANLDKAIAIFKGAIRQHNTYFLYMNLANAYAIKADWELDAGKNPAASIKEALENYLGAEQSDPDPTIFINRSQFRLTVAEFDFLQGRDPKPELGRACQDQQTAAQMRMAFMASFHLAHIKATEATYSWIAGRLDEKTLFAAQQHSLQAIKETPDFPPVQHCLARVEALLSLKGHKTPYLDRFWKKYGKELMNSQSKGGKTEWLLWYYLAQFSRQPSFPAYLKLEAIVRRVGERSGSLICYKACQLGFERQVPGMEAAEWRQKMIEHLKRARQSNPLASPLVDQLLRATGAGQ